MNKQRLTGLQLRKTFVMLNKLMFSLLTVLTCSSLTCKTESEKNCTTSMKASKIFFASSFAWPKTRFLFYRQLSGNAATKCHHSLHEILCSSPVVEHGDTNIISTTFAMDSFTANWKYIRASGNLSATKLELSQPCW